MSLPPVFGVLIVTKVQTVLDSESAQTKQVLKTTQVFKQKLRPFFEVVLDREDHASWNCPSFKITLRNQTSSPYGGRTADPTGSSTDSEQSLSVRTTPDLSEPLLAL